MTGEGFYYDLGSMAFWVVLALGGTLGIGYLAIRNKNKPKIKS